MTAKQTALAILTALPDECTWEQVRQRIDLYIKIEQGEAEIDAGGGIPNDRVMKEAEEWLASSGRPTLVANSTES